MAPRLLPSLVALAGLWHRGVVAEAEPEPEPKLGEPGFVAPNPPSCAVEWADTVTDLTEFGVSILEETSDCAHRLGWVGQTIWGNKAVWPLHHERRCAIEVMASGSTLFSAVSNLEASAFDCFGDVQACGQSIAAASEYFVDAGIALARAADVCPYVGDNPPWNSNNDLPIRGWMCWQNVWRVIQRLVKAAKYIDVAVTTCETTPPEPEPQEAEPEPEAEPPVTQGSVGVKEGAAPVPAGQPAAQAQLGAGNGTDWNSFQQPMPFAPATGAIERRLRAPGYVEEDPPMPSDLREVQRALEQFVHTFGSHGKALRPPQPAAAPEAAMVV